MLHVVPGHCPCIMLEKLELGWERCHRPSPTADSHRLLIPDLHNRSLPTREHNQAVCPLRAAVGQQLLLCVICGEETNRFMLLLSALTSLIIWQSQVTDEMMRMPLKAALGCLSDVTEDSFLSRMTQLEIQRTSPNHNWSNCGNSPLQKTKTPSDHRLDEGEGRVIEMKSAPVCSHSRCFRSSFFQLISK